jgi:hypothetical protein
VRWTEGRNLAAFVDLLSTGQVDVRPLITHRFSIEDAPAAYELITGKRQEPFLGVLLTYPQDPASASQARVETAGTGSIASPSHPGPEKVRLGVLGAGNFATAVMLPALKENPAIERVAIASASGLNARHAARRSSSAMPAPQMTDSGDRHQYGAI